MKLKVQEEDSVLCTVKSFEKYLSKRHAGTDRLFLHSKNNFSDNDPMWYRNEPLGVNICASQLVYLKKTQITALDQPLSPS